MIAFPIICAIISLLCAGVLVRDARRRPRPDKIVWAIAFLAFALAAASDAAGRAIEWTPWLARLYYTTGPALVVMYLAIGELYLLFPRQMSKFGVGATMLLTAFWAAMVVNAPIDSARLADDGWEAIERGTFMVLVTVLINSIGTVIIVGGTGYSVWNFWRKGIMRNRMIGCALIAIGTIVVGAGGTLTRLGHYEYLYIAMSVGVGLIFAGVLWTRRPDVMLGVVAEGVRGTESLVPAAATATATTSMTMAATVSEPPVMQPESDSIATTAPESTATPTDYIERILLPMADHELARACAEWSIPRDDAAILTRDEARQVWAFRQRLSESGRRTFDHHSVMARRQIVALHDEVMTPGPGSREEPALRTTPSVFVPQPPPLPSIDMVDDTDELASTYA